MEKYIPLIVGGFFLLFVIAGMFWGLIRGLKKSTFPTASLPLKRTLLIFLP